MALSTGKWYWEYENTTYAYRVGITGKPFEDFSGSEFSPGTGAEGYAYSANGTKRNAGSDVAYGNSFTTGDRIGVALDLDNGAIYFSKVDTWQNSATKSEIEAGTTTNAAFTGLTGTYLPCSSVESGTIADYFFASGTWEGTVPTGFNEISTANLDAPAIKDPSAHFQATLYTGNATAGRAITQDGNSTFGPDMVWIKNRDQADEWKALDTTRGATKELNLDSTNSESTDANGLTAFSATDGFTLGTGAAGYNDTGEDFVAYQWEKGVLPGFDIVEWTGTGANRTIAHNLSAIPKVLIIKEMDSVAHHIVYHVGNTSAPETGALKLNDTAKDNDLATYWQDTLPTSSVFSLGTNVDINENGKDYRAWLFAAIEGFSAFGSYIGNGSSNGPMINLGFKPALIVIKNASSTGDWEVYDSAISPGNIVNNFRYINTTNADVTPYDRIDMLSSGMKIRTSNGAVNTNGGSYIYMAWAESPFKTATAR
jgi:hypothetical protein